MGIEEMIENKLRYCESHYSWWLQLDDWSDLANLCDYFTELWYWIDMEQMVNEYTKWPTIEEMAPVNYIGFIGRGI